MAVVARSVMGGPTARLHPKFSGAVEWQGCLFSLRICLFRVRGTLGLGLESG